MRWQQLKALVALSAALGCGLDEKQEARECFGLEDCGDEQICFFGACVDPGYSIQSVHAELVPPNDSAYLPQQTREPLDLAGGYQQLQLEPHVRIRGSVADDTKRLAGSLLAIARGSIPGREITREASVSPSDGFTLKVIPGTYDLHFTPYEPGSTGETTLPPVRYLTQTFAGDGEAHLSYPSELVTVTGRVRWSETTQTGVGGALVSGTAQDAQGAELLSSYAVTGDAGEFTLVFPPGAEVFTISVRPHDNPTVPETTAVRESSGTNPVVVDDIVLGLEGWVSVEALVLDGEGAPVPNASVIFSGSVGALASAFVASATTDAAGKSGDLQLWPGSYRVTIVPLKDQPHALSESRAELTAAGPNAIELRVARKVRVSGRIIAHHGAGVAGARVILTLERDAPPPRSFATVTDPQGAYSLEVDPGSDARAAEYEMLIEPDTQSGLPRHRSLLRVGTTDLTHDVRLFRPTFVYGRIVEPGGAPLPQVTIAFYSLELGSPSRAILVGLGQSNAAGEFVVPLPSLDE